MSLVQDITDALALTDAYVADRERWHASNSLVWNKPIPESYPRFDAQEWEALSRRIVVKAHQLGLEGRLPGQGDSSWDYLGKTYLPGTWGMDGLFHPVPNRDWRDTMLTLCALAESLGSGPTPPTAGQADGASDAREKGQKNPKKSTCNGEARLKMVAALTQHHQYENGSCGCLEPIGVNDLARQAGVAPSTASAFFKEKFKGHNQYQALCRRSTSELVTALKLLRGELSPHILFGRTPPFAGRGAAE